MTGVPVPPTDDETSEDIHYAFSTASYKVIYIYSVPYGDHTGHLKIGDATLHTSKDSATITQGEILEAAHRRIKEQTGTAKTAYTLEHAELAVRPVEIGGERLEGFRDHKIHELLKRSGYPKGGKVGGEWFQVSLETAKQAIAQYKAHEDFVGTVKSSIVLRPEQVDAVNQSKHVLCKGTLEKPKRMLWNAKMRFGKTLTAYSLVKALASREEDSLKKILIMTHRPDVNSSWTEDFRKLFGRGSGWRYGAKRNDTKWAEVSKSDNFFWFASIQDLRGSYGNQDTISEADFEKLSKNEEVFSTEWDLVITDEAHEGTLTELAKRMFAGVKSRYFLDLSGTPFNIVQADSWDAGDLGERFSYDGQFNWSYPDERKAKASWETAHPEGDANPYAELPEIRFITYDVSDSIAALQSSSSVGGISFTELFSVVKTQTGQATAPRKFVHEKQVLRLLRKMQGEEDFNSDSSLFPYNPKFENHFRHTLWMLPNVPACEAMEVLLKQHNSGFSGFKVINATGAGAGTDASSWAGETNALAAVKKAIKTYENTITLSQQMLTTGVTIPEWTAVFMLNNTTSPMLYMQTAFRGTSPGSLPDGRVKEAAYVFDFNPDRCLREIVEIAKANAPISLTQDPIEQEAFDKASTNDYLEYISVLSMVGSKFVRPDSDTIMDQLNEAYVNEVIAKGFDSPKLWNNAQLVHFDIERAKILEALRKLQGGKESDPSKEVTVSKLSEADRQHLLDLKKQADEARKSSTGDPLPLTPEENATVKKLESAKKAEAKNRSNAISILVGVAAPTPMLVFASPAKDEITPQNFAELIDDESWQEFMPKNLRRLTPAGTPPLEERQDDLGEHDNVLYWSDVRRFFDPVIFKLATERIRQLTRDADSTPPLERAARIAALFSNFKNPDKETVLTPWRVVNLQYSKTLGGLNFVDLDNSTATNVLVYTKNLETGELESHPQHKAILLLDAGTHEIAPIWVTSDVDPVEGDSKDFWEDKELSVYDINSKTALYPLYAACSVFYAQRPHYRAARETKEQKDLLELRDRNLAEGRRVKLQVRTFTEEELDFDLWQEIIEKVIFVNARVAYSAKIAQRVLGGFHESIVANATVVDVIKLKKAIESWNATKKSAQPDYFKKIEDVYSFIGVALRLSNRGFLKSAAAAEGFAGVEAALEASDRVVEIIGKIHHGEWTMTEFNELLKLVEASEKTLPKLGCIVGNPPYQKSENGKNSDIWQEFIATSSTMSSLGSFIHPGRWVIPKRFMKIVQDQLVKQGLRSFDYLTASPFPGTYIDGNLTITSFDFLSSKNKPIDFSVNGGLKTEWVASEKFFSNEFEKELYKKVETLLKLGTMDDLRIGVLAALGGQDFGYRKADQISKLSKSSEHMTSPIKIWANPSFGKGTRFEWFYIDESDLIASEDFQKALTSRKVMLDKKGHAPSYPTQSGNVFNNKAEIVGKRTVASEKVFLVPVTDSKEDLSQIASLMMTKTARCLMSITQKDLYVRGLDNIPLYTLLQEPLNASGLTYFTDPWLFNHFEFSEELVAYIEQSVSNKTFEVSATEKQVLEE